MYSQEKVISDLLDAALSLKPEGFTTHHQIFATKWLLLCVCLQFESGWALGGGDCVCPCVVKSILFSVDQFAGFILFFF